MRNNRIHRNNKYSINKLDKSYERQKYSYQKSSKKKNENNISKNIMPFNKNNKNYAAYQSINRNQVNLNKKNIVNNEINIINQNKQLNLLKIQNNGMNKNRKTKNQVLKYSKTSIRRDCYTPDKNLKNTLKYNIAFTTQKKENKNNISLSKSNMKRNTSFIEYHYKNSSKKILKRSRSKNSIFNNISNDRKKPLTPDKINKTRNMKMSNHININKYGDNKRIKEPNNYFNLSNNQSFNNFSKSFNHKSNLKNTNSMDSNGSYGYFNKITEKRKTSDKYIKNLHYNKFHSRLSNNNQLPVLSNITKDKLSISYSSQYNSKNKKYKSNNDSYLLINLRLNKAKKNNNRVFNQNYSKAIPRAKSTDINLNKKLNNNNKLFFKYNNHNSKNININNNLINNISYDNINKKYNKTNNIINNNNLLNTNGHINTFNFTQKNDNLYLTEISNKSKNYENHINNNNFSIKNGIKKYEYYKQKLTSNSFLEMAQQKLNNSKLSSQKNYKYFGNNLVTKSSTNTNDDINSSNSIISKNNQIPDSIEEMHFNFVNVEQSTRNLMKIQENIQIDKIINNNSNSTIIFVEERDIE